jgi:hypothetical protein
MRQDEMEEAGSDETCVPRRGQEPTHDEDSLCLNLPLEFEDPEGWMSERRDYWVWLGEVGAPTRASWLRHRWMGLFDRTRDERVASRRGAV